MASSSQTVTNDQGVSFPYIHRFVSLGQNRRDKASDLGDLRIHGVSIVMVVPQMDSFYFVAKSYKNGWWTGYPYFRQPPNITINRPLTLMILPLTSAISKKWQFSTAQSQSIQTRSGKNHGWVLLGRFLQVFHQSPQDSHFMGPKKTYGFRQVHQESNSFDECNTSIMSSRLVRLGFTYPVRTRGCASLFRQGYNPVVYPRHKAFTSGVTE